MSVTIGINGFGRVGRNIFRAALANPNIVVAAINDPFIDASYVSYVMRYDSRMGCLPSGIQVSVKKDPESPAKESNQSSSVPRSHRGSSSSSVIVDGRAIAVHNFTEPGSIPWVDSNVSLVIECSGVFTTVERGAAHLAGGASRVIIAAASADAPTIILGANDDALKPEFQVISAGSCTAVALAPALRLLNDAFGIKECVFTSIHAITPQQPALDGANAKDYRLGRSADNIVPSSSTAKRSLEKVLPSLSSKVFGSAIRVPVSSGCLLDMTLHMDKAVTKAQLDATFRSASEEPTRMGKLIGFTEEPLVSSDFRNEIHSCVYDQLSSGTIGGTVESGSESLKVLLWYENEGGYAARLLELAVAFIAAGSK